MNKTIPEAAAPITSVIWAAFFTEQAVHDPVNTKAAVQGQLMAAYTWLSYAVDYYNKGATNHVNLSKKFMKLASRFDLARTELKNISDGVPIETDPAFAQYKVTIISDFHGVIGKLKLNADRFLEYVTYEK